MNKRILVVDDNVLMAMDIGLYISELGYSFIGFCSSVEKLYEKVIDNKIDLIIMDTYLRGHDGIEMILKIKKQFNIPVIFLTTHMDEIVIEKAITVNPVAYLTKPFNKQELFAAIKMGIKRTCIEEHTIVGDMYLDHEFSFNTKTLELLCCGENIHLTKQERRLLELFLRNKNTFVSFSMLDYELWPNKSSSDTGRRSLISRLRAKLKHKFLETYVSEGYIFKF